MPTRTMRVEVRTPRQATQERTRRPSAQPNSENMSGMDSIPTAGVRKLQVGFAQF